MVLTASQNFRCGKKMTPSTKTSGCKFFGLKHFLCKTKKQVNLQNNHVLLNICISILKDIVKNGENHYILSYSILSYSILFYVCSFWTTVTV